MTDWQHGLFACFNNLGLCIFTYIVPCYTFGKTAQTLGHDCCVCAIALLIPLVNIYALTTTRAKIRKYKDIEGNICQDFFTVFCCHFCSIIQQAQEMNVLTPLGAAQSIARS
jgi:Cys-rich protein (TIGR01571 family)